MLFLSEGSTHADLVAMAQEDYNLDMNTGSVELTYSLQQMVPNLPPIHVTSDRQVRNLLEITKTHEVRLAVDDLHGSLLVNAETYMEIILLQRQAWTPLDMEEDFVRRLPGSPEDFLEVVWKTSWKSSGRLPGSRLEDFLEVVWKTSWKSSSALCFRRLTGKSSQKSSRSEKPAYQIQI
ncbi:hypothetical protein F2Q69_00037094 [Brassica cretica]|uniref:Uncharacterized protein n=1 Tax=Brassica cretica TaxID=69181 RepID=A0A8S9SFK4_BRACR|nr:hypothetical protein F2Q69_00037094 [Brassica cretica]